MKDVGHSDSPSREVTLRQLLAMVWEQRLLMLAVSVVVLLVMGLLAWVTWHNYKASIVLAPAASTFGGGNAGGGSAVTSELGGLAALAGVSIGGDSRKWESVAVLQSEALTESYIRDHDLLPVLYRKRWDASRSAWNVTDPKKMPTLWKANQFFKGKIRAVTVDNKTSLVTLTITWEDPVLAAEWANGLVAAANDYLRTKAIEQCEQDIAYLTEQATRTNVVEVRTAIFSLLRNEINKEMLARGSPEYAFRILDPAVAPERPATLAGWLWIAVSLAACVAASLFVALARLAWGR
jgi:hypothetical protein